MTQVAVDAIQAMLAPVVLMTTTAIVAGGVQTMYAGVNDRMRTMTAEKLKLLTGADGELSPQAGLPGATRERVVEIDAQLPLLRGRHRMLHDALQFLYGAVLVIVMAMFLLSLAITVPAPAAGDVALVLVLVATAALLLGLIKLSRSVRQSANAVDYEVDRALRLGS